MRPKPRSTLLVHHILALNISSLTFVLGHAVAVYGSLNWGHDRYNISLDGYSAQYNGSSYWKVGETLLYFQSGLQVSQNHSIQLVNAIDGATTTLTRIDVWSSPVSSDVPATSQQP